MALTSVQPAMNLQGKNLHPFFSKLSDNDTTESLPYVEQTPNQLQFESIDKSAHVGNVSKKRNRTLDGLNQGTLDFFTNQLGPPLDVVINPRDVELKKSVSDESNVPARLGSNEGLDESQMKRQKIAFPELVGNDVNISINRPSHLKEHHETSTDPRQPSTYGNFTGASAPMSSTDDTLEAQDTDVSQALEPPQGEPTLSLAQSGDSATNFGVPAGETKIITSKKQIKITKSGKLLSSPPKLVSESDSKPKKKRGRPGKATVSPTVTIIKYGATPESRHIIGKRIYDILNGPRIVSTRARKSKKMSVDTGLIKSTHPFFTGKPGQKKDTPTVRLVAEQQPITSRKSAVTPGKLRAEAWKNRPPGSASTFSTSTTSIQTAKKTRSNDAPWPAKDTAHVRNEDELGWRPQFTNSTQSIIASKPRKLKNIVAHISDHDDIISRISGEVSRESSKETDQVNQFFKPPHNVRLPTRILCSGVDIQRKVYEQLQPGNEHLAVEKLLQETVFTMTAFDEGRCESQAWTHKYLPQNAGQVLNEGLEVATLKDWLQNLTVMAVGGALKLSSVSDLKNPPKKKRKKNFDAFIVSDNEDEDEEMIPIASKRSAGGPQPLSLRKPQWTRNNNVVLISGPHGCGKSAAVYAVAKDLDFEIFELNPGTRRSGKDIQEKVGDMAANHLVNHKRHASLARDDNMTASDTENEIMEIAFRKDLDSGRQGTVAPFFRPNKAVISKMTNKQKVSRPLTQPIAVAQTTVNSVSIARKSQKQSLILLEEADILFEEDQQFWAQVVKMASQSKRPIIITCNDERQIPLDTLPLAAVLRFSPPSVDLAANYLLAMAAREGHLIKRQAIYDLYRAKRHDLRASITDLDFWCQMSVGDRKGGLEWIFQRLPLGKDVDAHGYPIRVASEDTYRFGMGWYSYDMFTAEANAAFYQEEELVKEAWSEWDVEPMSWTPNISGEQLHDVDLSPMERLSTLTKLEAFHESRSATDIYCRVGLPSYEQSFHEQADPSQPPLSNKARNSYTVDVPVLQIDPQYDYLNLDTSISIQSQLLLERAFSSITKHADQPATNITASEAAHAEAIVASCEARRSHKAIDRLDFAVAFDVLAAPVDHMSLERTSYNINASSFDRTFSIITLDLAPYVRSIVAHEQVLETQRIRLSNLLSVGGTGKRARTTRASRTALEGGVRETKRRDRWFDGELAFDAVMETAGRSWTGMGWRAESEEMYPGTDTMSLTETQESAEGDVLAP